MSDRLNHSGSYPVGRREPRYVAPADGLHQPMPPSWDCSACAAPWPCQAKRRQLLAEYHGTPISLSLLMAVRLSEAAGDLTHAPAGRLHQRFLGWIRSSRAATDPPASADE